MRYRRKPIEVQAVEHKSDNRFATRWTVLDPAHGQSVFMTDSEFHALYEPIPEECGFREEDHDCRGPYLLPPCSNPKPCATHPKD